MKGPRLDHKGLVPIGFVSVTDPRPIALLDPYRGPRGEGSRERECLRRTFDAAADRYQRARPDYPERLFDDLERLAGLRAGDRLLEIGRGTGTATLPLARRGYRILAVELGTRLAEQASRNLVPFPVAAVVHGSFDEWQGQESVYDLVLQRQPGTGSILRPGIGVRGGC